MIPMYQVRLQPTKYFPAAPILLRVNVVCFPIASSHRFYVLFYSLYFSNGLFRYAVESELNYKAGSLFFFGLGALHVVILPSRAKRTRSAFIFHATEFPSTRIVLRLFPVHYPLI